MESTPLPPRRVFKFVGQSGLKILKTKTLRFTRPSLLNDPFEVRPFLKTLGNEADWFQHFKTQVPLAVDKALDNVPAQVNHLVSRDFLTQGLQSQKPFMVEIMRQVVGDLVPHMNAEFYKQIDAVLGILSLTEKHDSMLMWSHYGEMHRGIMLGFESAHPFFNRKRSPDDEFFHLRPVAYAHQRPHVDLLRTNTLELFLTKSQDWAYEKEWRMMIPIADCQEASPGVHVQSYPPECLEMVVLGANSSAEFRQQVVRTLRETDDFAHVRVFLAKLHAQEYVLGLSEMEA